MLNLLTSNAAALSVLGAAIAFAWSIVQFMLVRMREEKHREFEVYHRLVKELVAVDPESKVLWIDRQCAVMFELRQFKRYHELTLRTLLGLRKKWSADPDFAFPRLIEELDLAVDHIKVRSRGKL